MGGRADVHMGIVKDDVASGIICRSPELSQDVAVARTLPTPRF